MRVGLLLVSTVPVMLKPQQMVYSCVTFRCKGVAAPSSACLFVAVVNFGCWRQFMFEKGVCL